MAVRLRLKRLGRRHRPFFRICAMDSHSPRDGRVIEELGTYDPMVDDTDGRCSLKADRIDYWLSVGASPSEKVNALILSRAESHVEMVPQLARYLIEAGGKRLRPMLTVAAALARAAGARSDDVVWDPFVGSGLELVERGLLGPYVRLLGTDLDLRALEVARSNLTQAKLAAFELTQANALEHRPRGVAADGRQGDALGGGHRHRRHHQRRRQVPQGAEPGGARGGGGHRRQRLPAPARDRRDAAARADPPVPRRRHRRGISAALTPQGRVTSRL